MDQLAEYSGGSVDPGVGDRFLALLDMPQSTIFVAEDQKGQLVGLMTISQRWTLWHAGPCALIEELVVDKEARRQRVGGALIQAALDWAKARGCSEVEVSTEHENANAQAFYRHMGFDRTAVLLEYELEE
jgi:GNAT superfamily N-acetyltransferase